MLSIAKILGADEAVTIDGSTVTLRRPRTTLTKQYQFFRCAAGFRRHHSHQHGARQVRVVTVLSVGAQGAGKTTTLLGVALRDRAAFAALGAAADERLVTFSALASVVSGSPVRERLVDLLDDAPQPNAGLNVREYADGLPHAANFYADGLTQREVSSADAACELLRVAARRAAAEREDGGGGRRPRAHASDARGAPPLGRRLRAEVNLSFVDFAGVSRPRPAAAAGRGGAAAGGRAGGRARGGGGCESRRTIRCCAASPHRRQPAQRPLARAIP